METKVFCSNRFLLSIVQVFLNLKLLQSYEDGCFLKVEFTKFVSNNSHLIA